MGNGSDSHAPGAHRGDGDGPTSPVASGIGMVWARSRNGVIGVDGAMPWHLPEDLAHFRAVTGSSTVVMGRRTWESLPPRFRPLPGRRNVVLTRDDAWHDEGAIVAHDLHGALGSERPAWIIGGGAVYALGMQIADRIMETIVDLDVDGDTAAPVIGDGWKLVDEGPWERSRTGLGYRFLDWRRD